MSEKARDTHPPHPAFQHPSCWRHDTGTPPPETLSSGIFILSHCINLPCPMAISPSPLPGLFPSSPKFTIESLTLRSLSYRTLSPNFHPSSPYPLIPKHPYIRGSGIQTMLPPSSLYPQKAPVSGGSPFCLQHVTDALATGLSSADLAAGACGRDVVQAEGHGR